MSFGRIVLICLALVLVSVPVQAGTVSYVFTGTCSDCTGTGTGLLTLQDTYIYGNPIDNTTFVSFIYSSNLVNSFEIDANDINLSIANGDGFSIINLPLPAFESISISGSAGSFFSNGIGGDWSISLASVPTDFGASHQYALADSPEPSALFLAAAGLGIVLVKRRRRV